MSHERQSPDGSGGEVPDLDHSLDNLSLGEVRRRVDRLLDLIAAARTALDALERGPDRSDEAAGAAVFEALTAVSTELPQLVPSLLQPARQEAMTAAPGEELPRVSRARETELQRLYEMLAELPPEAFQEAAARHSITLGQTEIRLRRDRLWKIRMEDEATAALQALLGQLQRWVESLGVTLTADLTALAAALGGNRRN